MRTLLLATYLAVLLLPVGGIGFLRLYESALIRQTEAELLAQAAVLSATYRAAWLERASPEALAAMPAAKSDWGVAPTPASPERWRTLLPQLDLADSPILPRAPDPVPAGRPADPIALAVAKTLAPVLANVREMTLAGIRIVDAHGIVVASTANADLGLDMVRQEEVAEALQGAPVAMLRERAPLSGEVSWESISRTTALRVFVAVPVVADGRVLGAVLVSRTPRNIVQTLYSKRDALLALAVVLVASVAALAWFAGYTVVRPTRQLAAMARRVAAGDVRAVEPLAAPMTREARSLSDSIVVLARTLQMRADYVRELALSISHELKTPLTGIRGSTELLRDHLEEMSAEERARFLSNILADTARLERLVRRILELARAGRAPAERRARPATSCRRRNRSRLARDVSFRSTARRRRCPPQSTANCSISRSPTWSRTPSSMAGRRHRCASRRAPSRAASSSTCPTTGAAYRRPMPGGCSIASSRRRARPAAPVWVWRSFASGLRLSAAISACCRASAAQRSGSD